MSETLALSQSKDNMLVTLDRWDDGQVQVWNVEFLGEGMRNRVTFSRGRDLADVFSAQLAARLQDVLRGLDRHTRIFSDAEFELEMPGVRLRGLRLMIAQAKDTFDRVLVRFREVIGDMTGLFRIGRSVDPALARATDRVAVTALSDIVLPVCDIADSLRDMMKSDHQVSSENAQSLQARVHELAETSENVRLYLHLLMRYIEDSKSRREEVVMDSALQGLLIGDIPNAGR
ncbi:MAG: hypothetical protein AAGF71_09080 [Pseudomonadota bacterium]